MMTKSELIRFLVGSAGICGCSDDDRAVPFLLDLLESGEMRDCGLNEESDETLNSILPEGDILERSLPIYWLAAMGVSTHGDRLDSFGLSELGDEVLEALRTYGTGDELWDIDEDTDPLEGKTELDRSLN